MAEFLKKVDIDVYTRAGRQWWQSRKVNVLKLGTERENKTLAGIARGRLAGYQGVHIDSILAFRKQRPGFPGLKMPHLLEESTK